MRNRTQEQLRRHRQARKRALDAFTSIAIAASMLFMFYALICAFMSF